MSKYPSIDECRDEEIDECPWSVELDVSDEAVLMCIRWSMAEVMYKYIKETALKHRLALYDPQRDEVFLPSSLLDE